MIEPQYHKLFGDYKADVQPFTKLNWKTAASRDAWRDLVQRMSTAMSEAEWRSVMDDETEREAAIIHVDHQNRDKWLQRVGEHDLEYRGIRYSQPYDGFSHRVRPAEPSNPRRLTYAVIAENADVADKMEEAENEMDGPERHDKVGELLGFPECCREFFGEDWVQAGIRDPMYEITCNTPSAEMMDSNPNHLLVKDPEEATSVLWRYYGITFLTHMPCSWECEESVELARNRYRIMVENGFEEEANAIHEWLNHPFTWSCLKGIAHLQNTHCTAATNSSNYLNEKKITWKGEYTVQES